MTVKTIYKIKYDRNIVSEIISTTDYKIVDDNLKTNFGSLINNIKADLESYNIKYEVFPTNYIVTFTLAEGTTLPAGLELNTSTGEIKE